VMIASCLLHHQRAGRYDFWVCPGVGVQGEEELAATAMREVREESGLDVRVSKLLYVEELVNPEHRYVQVLVRGPSCVRRTQHGAPRSQGRAHRAASWLSRSEFEGKTIFPTCATASILARFESRGFPASYTLRFARMEFW